MILDIIYELRRDNGKLYKEAVLRKYKDDTEWLAYLVSVYNPFITYGESGDKSSLRGRDDLDNLRLCRSIDAGITATTINKIYRGLIPTASKMMKAKDKCVERINYPVYAGVKYDGNYTNVVVHEGVPKFFTSGGHEYTVRGGHPFELVPDGVYIAERIGALGKLGDRRKCNLKGSKPIQFSLGHTFKVFDYLTIEEFNKDKASTPYAQRKDRLHEILEIPHTAIEKIVFSRDELEAFMKEILDLGYEGLVLKQPDMMWRNSTSRKDDFAKYKRRPNADLLCVEEIEGEGKYASQIGSLLLRDSRGRTVSVGSGLADSDRDKHGYFVGKVIEIDYEQIMDTYIQPTIKYVREDKDASDID